MTSDVRELARRGRFALAHGHAATLLVDSGDRCAYGGDRCAYGGDRCAHRAAPLLTERAGRPRFVCESGCALTGAAHGREALLRVSDHGLVVVLTGTLSVVATPRIDAVPVEIIELDVTGVLIASATHPARGPTPVATHTWFAAEPGEGDRRDGAGRRAS